MSTTAIPASDLGMLEMTLFGIGSILFIVSLFCFFLVVLKMFQHKETAVGLLTIAMFVFMGIGQFFAVIFGWMKATDWNIKRLMTIYTVSLLLGIICLAFGYGVYMVKMFNAQPPVGAVLQMPPDEPVNVAVESTDDR